MKQMTPEEVLAFYKEKGLPETFCPVPFSTMIFEANGNVCLCRRKGADSAIGKIQEQSYEEIWNGSVLREIRKEFLSGNIKTCASEVHLDKCHLAADNADFLHKIDFNEIQKRPPLRLTPNFNGRCNLECQMCHIWEMPNGLYDQINFWPTLEKEILPHLTEIDTFSGEPFIQKDTYRLIDLAAQINPNIIWSFTTNAHWKFTDTIKNYLEKVHIKTFNLSIDSLDSDTYARIRHKGNLQVVLKTAHDLLEYGKTRNSLGKSEINFVLHAVIQEDNWREVPAFITFSRDHNILLHLNLLREPLKYSLLNLSTERRQTIVLYLLDQTPDSDFAAVAKLIAPLMDDFPPLDKADLFLIIRMRLLKVVNGGN